MRPVFCFFVCLLLLLVCVFVCLVFDEIGGEGGKGEKPSSRELVSIVRQCICVFV